MSNGWEQSAQSWIEAIGEEGDWGRIHVLDPVMLSRLEGRKFALALDVGCGEGRFCRMLKSSNIRAIGIDPTERLIRAAKDRDPGGDYQRASAESLPFADASFDLVVSYLTLIDIADFRAAIREMTRVLKPGGTLLIANLTSFNTACASQGWIKDGEGNRLHYPVDRYLHEFANWVEWSGIGIENWHRPLGAYMKAFLDNGLQLAFFDEPPAGTGDPYWREIYSRAPWFLVMEWRRPAATYS